MSKKATLVQTVSRGFVAVAMILAGASQAFGAQFHRIETLSSPALSALQALGKKAVNEETFGNCGFVSATKITSRRASEPWVNSVKQMLWGEYVEEIGAELVPQGRSATRVTVEAMTRFTELADFEDEAVAQAELDLRKTLRAVLETDDVFLLVKGAIGGAFSTSLGFFAVVDLTSNEMLAIGEGYCE